MSKPAAILLHFVAAYKLGPVAGDPGQHTVAVEFDLVQPRVTIGRGIDQVAS